MLDTFYGKTFLILGSQLAIASLTTMILLKVLRNLYYLKTDGVRGVTNEDGELDIILDNEVVKPYLGMILTANIVVFVGLMIYIDSSLYISIPLFTIWSIITGLSIGISLVNVDENLGSKVLALTALITIAAGLIGAKSGVDFSSLETGLYFCLLLLLGFSLIKIFFSIPSSGRRMGAIAGITIFTGYLLADFYRLTELSKNTLANTWPDAVRMSITIYLDIINLFLQLLELLSELNK